MLDKNDPRLTAYVLGELDEKEKAIVERAIAQNPELGQCVEDIGATASLLSEEFAAEPLVGLSDQHKVDVMDRTASPTLTVREKDEGTTSTKGFVLKYWAWAAAAACLMAIAVPVLRERYAGSFTAYSAASSAKSESVVDARTAPDGEDAPETNFPMTSEGKDFDRLIELITETVSPEWDEVGGPGAIEEFDGNLSLVIQNTQNVHDDAEPTDGLNDVTQEFVET